MSASIHPENYIIELIFKKWAKTRPLFVYFNSFHNAKKNLAQI